MRSCRRGREAARHIYEQLTPYDGQLLLYGFHFVPASTAFMLGLMAETLGERERALDHYRSALAFEEQCDVPILAARTRQSLAQTNT